MINATIILRIFYDATPVLVAPPFCEQVGEARGTEASCQKKAVFIHWLATMVKPLYLDTHDRAIRVDIELIDPDSHRTHTTIGET
jgi:hypothetical protein